VFAEFDAAPLAAASIGQAHRARLHGGEQVIVKVLRPGIGDAVERDLLVLDELARTVEARTPWGAEYRVTELSAEFAARLREELDLQREARNAATIAANLADLPEVHIPVVHPELSTSKLLVMEWLDGASVGDQAALDALGVDRRALADLLLLLFAFGVTLPPEFSTFFRALVTLEGTITTLSPGYPVIQAAQEVAAEWAGERSPRPACRSWPAASCSGWLRSCAGPPATSIGSPPWSSGATCAPGSACSPTRGTPGCSPGSSTG
jgi:predicted unusual protein kinase regulating ubiquinone biosynthesis (AarF/ABC1/UbiB family)